jgi:integrase
VQLIKKKYTAANGERREGRVWTVRYHCGGRQYEKSLGTRDKRVAELLGAALVRKAELRRAGVLDPFAESKEKPLAEHFADFLTTMRARNVVPKYLADREKCLKAYATHAKAKCLADLDLPRASAWLSDLKATGVSARTVNVKYQSLRQFGLWLVQTRRSAYDPVEGLKPLNEAEDRRHVRRALTLDEARRLLRATKERALARAGAPHPKARAERRARLDATRAKMTRLGEARALIYVLAIWTGLRKGELTRLRWCDLDLVGGRLTVTAASAKSRRVQTVELHPRVVEALVAARPATADITDPVVAARHFPTCRTFDEDLKAAGIPKTDATGLVVDFHALRMTFISWLAATGAHPRTAQRLARHASIETTMERYTDLRLLDLQGAIGRLPSPDAPTAGAASTESA